MTHLAALLFDSAVTAPADITDTTLILNLTYINITASDTLLLQCMLITLEQYFFILLMGQQLKTKCHNGKIIDTEVNTT